MIRWRKLALTAHVITSVGWLGAITTFLALAIVGLASEDGGLVRSVYIAAEPVTWFVIVPFALATMVTGILQSLSTRWGLIRHYWVIFKLVIAVVAAVVLLQYTQTVELFADRARNPSAGFEHLQTPSFVLHSAVGLVLLVTASALAVFKPKGQTRYGRRTSA